jgi:hypothetical protein
MVSVVLMAGQSPMTKEYREIIEKDYGEHTYFFGYKPLKTFKGIPLIIYSMESLEQTGLVNDIVICGDKKRLESKLGGFISRSKKEYRIIDQFGSIDEKVLQEFNAKRENFAECSIAANALKGYTKTEAYKNKDYALFMASDSPKTSTKSIIEFLDSARNYTPKSPIIFPLVNMSEKPFLRLLRILTMTHWAHRKYIFLINNTEQKFRNSFRTLFTKRDGFRVSSMVYIDPFRTDIDKINQCYSLRKMYSQKIREEIKDMLKKHDLVSVWEKYFFSKDLSIRDCENGLSKILCRSGKATILPTRDIASTYDFDGTIEDYRMINSLLNKK